jgi:hypothetical protein
MASPSIHPSKIPLLATFRIRLHDPPKQRHQINLKALADSMALVVHRPYL